MTAAVSIATLLSFSTWVTTSFNTIYQTSIPVIAVNQTSIASQFSTAIRTSSITQPEIIMASTIAIPVTLTSTLTNVLANSLPTRGSVVSIPTSTVTETIVSTISQPYRTLTYYPPTPTTTIQVTTKFPPVNTIVTVSPTITITEIVFYLENGGGNVCSTITTTLPAQTSAVVIVPGYEAHPSHGWDSWSDAQKGGLIAGVILAFLLLVLLVLLIIWCMRRRNLWVAGEWETNPSVALHRRPGALVIPQSYWGAVYGGGWRI